MIRAKVKLLSITYNHHSEKVARFKIEPYGSLEIQITNTEDLKLGQDYYIDLTNATQDQR